MELSEQLLKELQKLQELYKVNFDLVSQKVDNQAEQLKEAKDLLQEASEDLHELHELLKEVIAEKDVQVQKLIKATAALTVIADQLTTRFNTQE